MTTTADESDGDEGSAASSPAGTANYGIDAPTMVMTFVALAVAATFAGIFIGSASGVAAGVPPWIVAFMFAGTAAFMVYSSKKGKPALWVNALDELDLRGNERALDVGCGRGLVMIALAKRLPKGHVTGIDIWRGRDQSGNDRSAAERNAAAEGVTHRVEIVDANMTDIPFDDNSFELVTASLAIHNLPLEAERDMALDEMARVLRPGGRIVIIDIGRTGHYVKHLTELGCADVYRSGMTLAVYPPARTVTATKPGKRAGKSQSSRTTPKKGGKR